MHLVSKLLFPLLALVAVAVTAPAAHAGTQSTVDITDGVLRVDSVSANPHAFVISSSDAVITISDAYPMHTTGSAVYCTYSDDFLTLTCDTGHGGLVQPVSSVHLTSGNGADTIDLRNARLPATVFGGDGDDVVTGSDLDDLIDGGGHNDTIDGRLGRDNIQGAAGADKLYGGGGSDTLNSVNADVDTANSCDMSLSPGGDVGPGTADTIHMDRVGDTQDGTCETVEKHGAEPLVPPTNTVAPASPSGTVKVGQTITSSHGTWTGSEPITFVTT